MKLPVTEKFLWDIYDFLYKNEGSGGGLYGTILDPYAAGRFLRGGGSRDALQEKIYAKYRKKYGKENFSKFIYYLKKKGYIDAKSWEVKHALMLTPKGLNKIFLKQEVTGKLSLRQDGKWQMVLFDIPEKVRKLRNQFRFALKSLGYKQLQQSAWVSPYDVADKTKNIISGMNIEDDVRLFVIDSIEEMSLKDSKE